MRKLFAVGLLLIVFLLSSTIVFAWENKLPEEAYALVSDPGTYILDVRTPAEWAWVGHPGKVTCKNGDVIGAFLEEPIRKVIHIPWLVWEYVPQNDRYEEVPNRFFDEEVLRQFSPDDIIIIMCRSGGRSVSASEELGDLTHPAFKRLERLGFNNDNVYNMVEGFEGGKDDCGYRTLDAGWKNKGLPYNFSKEGIWVPHQQGRSLK
jgi:rhodanese-related sulfurtransferase